MNKKVIYLLAVLFIAGFTSCKNCVDCTNCNSSFDETEICKESFETRISFNARVSSYESSTGCSCD